MKRKIDGAIIEAIDEAISTLEADEKDFARKFRRRIELKLTGQFRESDLLDLIEEVPLEPEEPGS